MRYNEWRDELKNNLLSVSDEERVRVLDYYAEAYADRREAGFTESEITAEFGAPYDAAQRILGKTFEDVPHTATPRTEQQHKFETYGKPTVTDYDDDTHDDDFIEPALDDPDYYEQTQKHGVDKKCKRDHTCTNKPNSGDYTWVFVLLCIIFAIPLFSLVMTMVGVTIGLCVAPFGLIVGGAGGIAAGITIMFSSGVMVGIGTIGAGLIELGLGMVLMPLLFKLVKLMWKLFKMLFAWIKRQFGGKESVQ